MYFTQATALALTLLLSALSSDVQAVPLSTRQSKLSASYSSLSKPILSPYYVYFGNTATKKLSDAITSPGMKAVTLGFASAPKGKCALTDDLNGLVTDSADFIGKGGALNLGFGGNLQDQTDPRQHVQQACTDAPSLAKLIQSAMTQFNTNNIEFDIEDNSLLSDTASAKKLGEALVTVKKAVPGTYITYTMGCTASGLLGQQLAYLQAAKDAGLTVDGLNLMTMNMGGTDNVKDAQSAIAAGAKQLAKVYGLSTDAATKKMGMLPAIGVDNDGQIIDLDGATTLAQFAKKNSLAILSYWNFNRDFPGNVGAKQQDLSTSSSPDEKSASQFFTTMQSALGGGDTSKAAAVASVAVAPAVAAGGTANAVQPAQKAALPPATADAAPQGVLSK